MAGQVRVRLAASMDGNHRRGNMKCRFSQEVKHHRRRNMSFVIGIIVGVVAGIAGLAWYLRDAVWPRNW